MATAAIPAMIDRSANALWSGVAGRRATGLSIVSKPGPERTTMQEMRGPEAPLVSSQPSGPSTPSTPVAAGAAPQMAAPPVSAERAAALAEQKKLADLAARCLAGDGEAWETLTRTQHRRIYGICYRFTGSQSDAEDLTQEAFLKMFKNLSSFDPTKGGFTTWLTTLTRNLLVDNYRRTRMDRVSDSLDETFDGEDDGATKVERLVDGGKSQEELVAGSQLRAQIQEALKQVSPDLREAVILRDLEDMDYKDIAEVLGVPQGTVKSRISRGRSELARLLKRIEGQVM